MVIAALEASVWESLSRVMDPEIPAVSVVDMGMIKEVAISDGEVKVTVLPTFAGCPAVQMIQEDIRRAVTAIEGVEEVVVATTFSPPWTTERITPEGHRKLKDFGVGPPRGNAPVLVTDIGLPRVVACPLCGSKKTHNENAFGPTPCRALYYCNDCRNPFEQFKTV